MSQNTLIEWAHHTVNFWWGCAFARYLDGSIREECIHCYAKRQAPYFGKGRATWGEEGKRWIRAVEAGRELMALDRSARNRGVRERVFINSMSDFFEDRRDLDDVRSLFFAYAIAVTNLDLLLLTKRPQNVLHLVPPAWLRSWPAWVWMGTTAGTQKAANEVMTPLMDIPSTIHFVSCEPLLEAVDLYAACYGGQLKFGQQSKHDVLFLDWVIVGGESGPGARPMQPHWARSLRDQCEAGGAAFFFKQWGEWIGGLQDGAEQDGNPPRYFNATDHPVRCGRKVAGRLLDGMEYGAVPEVTP